MFIIQCPTVFLNSGDNEENWSLKSVCLLIYYKTTLDFQRVTCRFRPCCIPRRLAATSRQSFHTLFTLLRRMRSKCLSLKGLRICVLQKTSIFSSVLIRLHWSAIYLNVGLVWSIALTKLISPSFMCKEGCKMSLNSISSRCYAIFVPAFNDREDKSLFLWREVFYRLSHPHKKQQKVMYPNWTPSSRPITLDDKIIFIFITSINYVHSIAFFVLG